MAGDETANFVKKWGPNPDCAAIRLWSCAVDSSRTLCDSWPLPMPNGDALELIEQIEERALRQANTFGGSQAFMLEAVNKGDRPMATDVFRVYGEALPGATGGLATEPANEAGHVAQMMRHNEAIFRSSIMGQQGLLKSAHQLLELSDRRAERAEDRSLKWLEQVAAIATQEREREVALKKEEGSAESRRLVTNKLLNLLPMVASSVVGNKPGHEATGVVIGLKSVFESLSQEQMVAILNLLSEDQRMAFLQQIKKMADPEPGTPSRGPTEH